MEATVTLQSALAAQLDRQLAMWREALTDLDDATFCRGDGYLCPARLAYHALETIGFYLRDERGDFAFGGLGGDWEGSPVAELPSREQLLAYADRVEAEGTAWLAAQDEASLLGPTGFEWTGDSRLEQVIYLLRHTQHHLGELNALLRTWDVARVEWQ